MKDETIHKHLRIPKEYEPILDTLTLFGRKQAFVVMVALSEYFQKYSISQENTTKESAMAFLNYYLKSNKKDVSFATPIINTPVEKTSYIQTPIVPTYTPSSPDIGQKDVISPTKENQQALQINPQPQLSSQDIYSEVHTKQADNDAEEEHNLSYNTPKLNQHQKAKMDSLMSAWGG